MTDDTTKFLQESLNLLGDNFTINATAKVKTKGKRVEMEVFVRSYPRNKKELVKKLKKMISDVKV